MKALLCLTTSAPDSNSGRAIWENEEFETGIINQPADAQSSLRSVS